MSLTEFRRGLRQRLRRLAVRGPVPEPLPLRLRARRVYVFPSKAGFALLGTLLVMLIASINYNLSLGYALVFTLGSVFAVHILHAWRTVHGLEINLGASEEAFAGSEAAWQLQLHNPQTHERPALRVLDGDGRLLHECDLAARARALTTLRLPVTQRGWRQPGQLSVESYQPLGWIRAWSHIEPDAPLLVYPAPRGELALPMAALESGDAGSGLRGQQQDDFAGLRSFQPGDSLRQVAWKQLARGQGMLTKVFASQLHPECVLDWDALPATLSVESRLSQLTRWVLDARAAGARTTLLLPGSQIGPGSDAAHHQSCLQRLALYEASA